MNILNSTIDDGELLAEIRARAMKESLVAVGRFDEQRVRNRFLDNFIPEDTFKIVFESTVVGFYVTRLYEDYIYLDHLYILPEYQGNALGAAVIERVKQQAINLNMPIKLGALRDSRSNSFYLAHGFEKTHEDEFDIYYAFSAAKIS